MLTGIMPAHMALSSCNWIGWLVSGNRATDSSNGLLNPASAAQDAIARRLAVRGTPHAAGQHYQLVRLNI